MSTARTLPAVLLTCLTVLLPATLPAAGCEDCHSNPAFQVRDRKLYDYYQDWLTSPHKQARVTCDQCHGGDPSAADKDAAHTGRGAVLDPRSTVFFKKQPQTCGRCHEEVSRQFTGSRHCSKVLSDDLAPTCTTCHRAMNKKPYYRDILREGCQHCHGPGPGQRRTEVIDQAAEILHRLNIARGFLGWTTVHFERDGWPADSKSMVEGLRRDYHAALARIHSLELLSADQASVELLAALKRIFNEHRASPPVRPGGG
jgi:hypothetical protein